jgi:hypothetical protein
MEQLKMNKLFDSICQQIVNHWQFILGGLMYFLGKDILSAAEQNYWSVQIGHFMQDVSVFVIGFKAVSGVYTPALDNK